MKKIILMTLSLFLLLNITYAQGETEKSALEKAKNAEDNQDYEMALKWFKKANQLNPKNGTTYYDVAWCENELEKYSDVLRTAEAGIKVAPTAKLYSEYAYALYMLERDDEAIEKYKKALALNPDEKSAVKGIADVYFTDKDYNNAEIYYKKCLDLGKDPKVANYKLGYIMNEHEKYQKAVDYELAAIKLDDEYAAAYNELGYAYSQLNQKSNALDNYIKAHNLNPKNATYAANVADIYYGVKDLEDLDKAVEYYKKSLAIENKSAISNYRLGWILNDKEKYNEAKPYLYKAVELDPKYADAWIELGWIDYSQENYSAAESDYLKALQYNSKSELARYYLGQVYIKQNKKSNAQKMLDELKSMDSKYADKLKAKM
ncbi:MAG: tetratricopeptide repeat protein [Chitinophagales bacterium]